MAFFMRMALPVFSIVSMAGRQVLPIRSHGPGSGHFMTTKKVDELSHR